MTEVTMQRNLRQHWHGVLTETDTVASDPSNIDLACMLVHFTGAKVIVEAGTYYGHLTLATANILRQAEGGGMIYSADPIDTFSKTLAQIPMLQPFIQYHPTDYLEMLKQVKDPIDMAYIDASAADDPHMRWTHAQATLVRMKRGGLLLIDDTEGDWEDAQNFKAWARTGGIHLGMHRGLTILQRAL